MTKRLIAVLLAAMMLLAFVACSDDGTVPPAGGDGTNAGNNGDTNAPSGNDTQAPDNGDKEPVVYQPDADCPYNGYIGIGAASGTAYFDDLKVTDQGGAKFQLLDTGVDDSETLPEFHALGSTDAVTPNVVTDPLKDSNKVIEVAGGSNLMTGDRIWNYYQFRMKVLPADENTEVEIYFCVNDENNYYVLVLGENGNTNVTCYKVTDGVKENAQFTVRYSLELDAATSVGITVGREYITIYVAGIPLLEIGNDELVNDYYDYNGTQEPSSVVQQGLGAPGENLEYYPVDPENVIHDGLGTWSNDLTHIATTVFDKDYDTFYDADANREYTDDVEGELPGIPGDKTHPNGYVGAYFPEGVEISFIRYAPRPDGTGTGRMGGGTFEVSTDGVNWTEVHTIEDTPVANMFTTVRVELDGPVNYVRYVSPASGFCNIAEIEVWGPMK